MCCPCCMTSLYSRIFYSLKSCDQSCDYAIKLWLIWQHDWSTLTRVVLKIETKRKMKNKNKIKWKKKIKYSPPLMILTLLLLRNNWIPLYQSSNFILSPLNHSRSGTILFSIIACSLLFIVTGAGATDISLSDHLFVSSEASFIIYKNPSLSNSASILSICLELILVLLMVYTTHVLFIVWW